MIVSHYLDYELRSKYQLKNDCWNAGPIRIIGDDGINVGSLPQEPNRQHKLNIQSHYPIQHWN